MNGLAGSQTGYAGQQQAQQNAKQVIGNPPVDGISQVAMQNLKSLRELNSRLSRIADAISGCQPECNAKSLESESSLFALTNDTAYAIQQCHEETNRVLRGLGIQL